MERDPDYMDPAELRRRAASGEDAGAVSGRPRLVVRGTHEQRQGVTLGTQSPGVVITRASSVVSNMRFEEIDRVGERAIHAISLKG